MENIIDLSSFEPNADQTMLAKDRERRNAEKEAQSVIFTAPIPPAVGDCDCGQCGGRVGIRPPYCCRTLWTYFDALSTTGRKMQEAFHNLLNLKESEIPGSCITAHPNFQRRFLDETVAEASSVMFDMGRRMERGRRNETEDQSKEHDKNASLRYGSYRWLIAYIYKSELGIKKRVELPQCVYHSVRTKWPSSNGEYRGFMEAPPTMFLEHSPEPMEIERLRSRLSRSARSFLCLSHFPPEDLTPNGNAKIGARPTADGTPIKMPPPPPSPAESESRRAVARKLFQEDVRRENRTEKEADKEREVDAIAAKIEVKQEVFDADFGDAGEFVSSIEYKERRRYTLVDMNVLIGIYQECPKCDQKSCTVRVWHEGAVTKIRSRCTLCRRERRFDSSPVVPTQSNGDKEKLHAVSLDTVGSAMCTSYGYGAIAPFAKCLGLAFPSESTFHRVKRLYFEPALEEYYQLQKDKIFDSLLAGIENGDTLRLSGDAQFDSRGFSAIWGRYILLSHPTGHIISFANVSKVTEGVASSKLEVLGLERCLEEVVNACKESNVNPIRSLTTDRNREVIAFVRDSYPAISHKYDAWHFCRNVLLQLVKKGKAQSRATLASWIVYINNHVWWSITTAKAPGEAYEKLRGLLHHITGTHEWKKDKGFRMVKGCATHSRTHKPTHDPYMTKQSASYKALEKIISTPGIKDDIGQCSADLGTSLVENFNFIATQHAPKERFFSARGHDIRTKIAIIRHNETRDDEMNGLRTPIGRKRRFHKTLKVYKERAKKPPCEHRWRNEIIQSMHRIRRDMTAPPSSTVDQDGQEIDAEDDEEPSDDIDNQDVFDDLLGGVHAEAETDDDDDDDDEENVEPLDGVLGPASSENSTNPNPLARPVSRSKTMRTLVQQRLFEGNALLRRLVRVGVLTEDRMKLDYVLELATHRTLVVGDASLEVFKLGLAKSIHHGRVLIRQKHIRVRRQVVNVPSFVVRLDSQEHIDFSLKSPFGGGRAGRVKRANAKKGTGGGAADEDDE